MSKRRTLEEIKQTSPLAAFVREKRKMLGLTQEELASRVGLGLATLKRLETGDINLQYAKILQVLDYFGAELVPQESES